MTPSKIQNIHLIGIGGIAMGSLAAMLKGKGYHVSGSDSGLYPPMSDMLPHWGIKTSEGYSTQNLNSPDLVIIGNAVSRGNPEVEYVLDRDIPYMSMAQALRDFCMKGKEVIAVAGTHGKSTTASLLAHILETAGAAPSFFIGAILKNYDTGFRIGKGSHFVIEGDEYDSAFFEKIPKFILYRPRHLILTSLEYDHADIYHNIEEIHLWFKRLVSLVPSRGNIIFYNNSERFKDIPENSFSQCSGYGIGEADYSFNVREINQHRTSLEMSIPGEPALLLETELFGDFNYMNITAASAMALKLGIDRREVLDAVQTFKGVKRRQDVLYEDELLLVYEDFAHHPTAIKAVLLAVRNKYPRGRIYALYEPRSATSRRNVFQDSLPSSFVSADCTILNKPYRLETLAPEQRLDVNKVVADIRSMGGEAYSTEDVDEIIERVFGSLDRGRKNIVVIMSNGGFDGIYEKIVKRAG